LYPEIDTLLREVAGRDHTGVVVVTCGLRRVWELVLQAARLSASVAVVGGSRIDDRYVVTPEVKAAVVAHLQRKYHTHVCAIGDSPLDVPMLEQADQAVVVVGDPAIRSSTMEPYLQQRKFGIFAHQKCVQVLLPGTREVAKLNVSGLPVGTLSNLNLLPPGQWQLETMSAGSNGPSKILASSTRNSKSSGRALQEAHRNVGWYLAMEYMTRVMALESFKLPHVQGGHTIGYRLSGEGRTTIIALMRGGEPMAFGVHDAFPNASFLHATQPTDIKLGHIKNQETLILVDSVINSGKSISEHVNHIRAIKCPARIVIIAGVVQEEAIQEHGLVDQLRGYGRLSIICLRTSANKYTGRGGTDTGNRLFNTTHLD
jgi:uracil phosphoribosyltransferase